MDKKQTSATFINLLFFCRSPTKSPSNEWDSWNEANEESPTAKVDKKPKKTSSKKKASPKEGLLVDIDNKAEWNHKWEDDEAWDALNKN